MAFDFRPTSAIFMMLFFFFLANAVNSIPTREFDSMLDTLRVRGYDLFCNALVTSDLQFDLLYHQNEEDSNTSFNSFTFFAPTDSSLFALDMTQTASSYTDTLRFHVVPRRLSSAVLHRLPDGYSLPTLLPERYLNVTRSPDSAAIAVGGVNIAFPGLFYGRNVAVHGLAGIISLRSNNRVVSGSPPGVRSSKAAPNSLGDETVLPPSPSARPVVSPIPQFNSFNVTKRPDSPPSVEISTPANRTAHDQAHESTADNSHSPASSPIYRTVHAPSAGLTADDSDSPAGSLVIHGGSPATSTESPAYSYVLTPVAWPPFTPVSESPEYLHYAISAPPVEYSEATVPAPLGSDVLPQKRDRVSPMETFTRGSEGVIEAVKCAGEVQETRAEMKDVPEKPEPLNGIGNCEIRDIGQGLESSFTRDRAQYM